MESIVDRGTSGRVDRGTSGQVDEWTGEQVDNLSCAFVVNF